jgi:hypothetical protein
MSENTTAPAARKNPHTGRDCPDWCTSGHTGKYQTSCVGSGTAGLRTEAGNVWARAMITPDGPRVALNGSRWDEAAGSARSAYLAVGPRDAEDLALLVELLAGATPEQVRMVAAGIRRAATDLDGQGEA